MREQNRRLIKLGNEIIKNENNVIAIPEGNFNTVDISTFEGAAKLTNAINNSRSLAEYIDDNDNPILKVVDIIVTAGYRKARDGGEDTPCEDTRLVLEDGTSLLSQSGGIARSARFIAGFLGSALHNGILIRVSEQKLRNGNTIKNLEVVGKVE